MRKNPRQSWTGDRQRGFTMIEMLVTMTVLVAILGIVFSYIGRLQKTYKAEETKVDATQEARTFFDSLQRELHSAGFPNHNMYGTGILNATAANDSKNAVGLVSVTKRSEEHTSELQSHSDLVCRLLLEKKKKNNTTES